MLKNLCSLLACLLLFLCSCKKIEEQLNFPPDNFEAYVNYRSETTAEISWKPSSDPDGDEITYSVEIGGKIVASKLTKTTYLVTNLSAGTNYQGRIIATDSKNAYKAAPFSISTYQEQVLFFNRNLGFVSYNLDGKRSWKALDDVQNTPALSNDTAFINDNVTLYAINLKDGATLMKVEHQQSAYTGITYHKGVLLFSSYLKIKAVRANDGTLLWSMPYDFVVREIIAADGIAYISAAERLIAVDLITGNVKWTAQATQGFFSSLIAKNGVVYSLTTTEHDKQGRLHAFNAKTGNLLWNYIFDGTSLRLGGASAPTISGNLIYFPVHVYASGYYNFMYAVNTTTGTLAWKQPINDYGELYSVMSNDLGLFVCSTARLIKMDLKNGNTIWTSAGQYNASFTLAKDKIFATMGTFTGQTAVIDVATGQKTKTINTISDGSAPIVIRNGEVFYPSNRSGMAHSK